MSKMFVAVLVLTTLLGASVTPSFASPAPPARQKLSTRFKNRVTKIKNGVTKFVDRHPAPFALLGLGGMVTSAVGIAAAPSLPLKIAAAVPFIASFLGTVRPAAEWEYINSLPADEAKARRQALSR